MCAWRRCLWAQHPLASVALKLEGFLKHQKCCQVAHLVGKSGRSSCRRRCLPNPSNYLLNKKRNTKDNETVVHKLDDDKSKWWCSKSIVHFSQQSVSPHHSQVSHKKVLLQIMESRILHFCSSCHLCHPCHLWLGSIVWKSCCFSPWCYHHHKQFSSGAGSLTYWLKTLSFSSTACGLF